MHCHTSSVCLTSAGREWRVEVGSRKTKQGSLIYHATQSIDGKLPHSNGTIYGEFLLVIILVYPGAMNVNRLAALLIVSSIEVNWWLHWGFHG